MRRLRFNSVGYLAAIMVPLVLLLRLWADYDQYQLQASLPGAATLLLNHAPADTLRFLINLPASFLARYLAPPPVYSGSLTEIGYAAREAASIAIELCLTALWWLTIGSILQTQRGSLIKRVPLKVLLPVIMLLATSAMNHFGDLQYQRVMNAGAPQEHGLPESLARDRFVGYALNGPAWALWQDIPTMLYSNKDIWRVYLQLSPPVGRTIEYLGLTFMLWLTIGAQIDNRKRETDRSQRASLTWLKRLMWISCALYSAYLLNVAIWSYYEAYHERWFSASILTWSGFLIGSAFRHLSADVTEGGRRFGRIFGTCIAALACAAATLCWSTHMNLANRDNVFAWLVLCWGFFVLMMGLYRFLRRSPVGGDTRSVIA